jgi:hypothetical protein
MKAIISILDSYKMRSLQKMDTIFSNFCANFETFIGHLDSVLKKGETIILESELPPEDVYLRNMQSNDLLAERIRYLESKKVMVERRQN